LFSACRRPVTGGEIDCRSSSCISTTIPDNPMTLISISTAWLTGIATAHYSSPPLAPSAALRAGLIGLVAALPVAGLILWRDDRKVRRTAACGLFLLLGSLRYTLSLPALSDLSHIAAHRDQGKVTLGGRVVGGPGVRDTYTNLRLTVDRVRIEDEEHWAITLEPTVRRLWLRAACL
jgi:hypothetical protein